MEFGRMLAGVLRRFCHSAQQAVEVPAIPIAEFLLRHVDKYPRHPALIDGENGDTVTFEQLAEEVWIASGGLQRLGLRPGDSVCLFAVNSPRFAHVLCSVTNNGASLSLANPLLNPCELAEQLKTTKAKFLVTSPCCAENALAAAKLNTTVKEVIVLGIYPGCRPFQNLLSSGGPPYSASCLDPVSQVALIPFSSGTTGKPKGVMLTHTNLVAELTQLQHRNFLPLRSGEDLSLSMLPMVHVAGLMLGMCNPLAQGVPVVTLSGFHPEQYLRSLQDYKATFALVAPPVVSFLVKSPLVDNYNLRHVTNMFSGAATLGGDLIQQLARRLRLPGIRQGYGMSETSPATHVCPLSGWKDGSVGVPLPLTACQIRDLDNGTVLGIGHQGEVCVRGPQVMLGYLDNPQATTEAFTEDGWLRTGDIGYYDEDGHYFIVDRLKEIIKYKGYQVAPAYLEETLLSHPAVQEAAVIGIAAPEVGELPRAYVVLKAPATEEELMAHVAERVAPYRRLRGGVKFVTEIPKSPSGKILRRVLRNSLLTNEEMANQAT